MTAEASSRHHQSQFSNVIHRSFRLQRALRFERQAKIYGDAANALLRARADSPDLKPPTDDAAFQEALRAHVEQIEQILRTEQAQWGQLIGEIKPVAPPQSNSIQER